jgi:hypothetical protein
MSSPRQVPSHRIPEKSSVYVISIDTLHDNLVRLGAAYWRGLRGARRFPARDEISPRAMIAFLRNIALVRVIDGGADYEYRIAGDAHIAAFGAAFQGVRLSKIEAAAPDYGRVTRATYEHVRNTAEPLCIRGWVGQDAPDSRFTYHESAFLPLGPREEYVDHLLIVSAYIPRARTE